MSRPSAPSRFRRRVLSGAFLALSSAAVLSAPASAAVMMATYTGVITTGFDHDLVFGGRSNLAGAAFQTRFVYDTTRYDNRSVQQGSNAHVDMINGQGAGAPILSVSVTVNGVTDVLSLTSPQYDYGYQTYDHAPGRDLTLSQATAYQQSAAGGYAFYEQAFAYFYSLQETPLALDMAFSATPAVAPSSMVQIINQDAYDAARGRYRNHYMFQGAPTMLSVVRLADPTAAVPEPSTWALLIVGFGSVGLSLRQPRGAFAPVLARRQRS